MGLGRGVPRGGKRERERGSFGSGGSGGRGGGRLSLVVRRGGDGAEEP